MQTPHQHKGKSSEHFFDKEILLETLKLPKNANLLEIGCGNGYLSLAIAEKKEFQNNITAIDLNQNAITELNQTIQKNNLQNLQAICLDFSQTTKFQTNQFDYCFMVNVAHGFIANQEAEVVFSEIYRILKPQGTLSLIEFKKIHNIPGPPYAIKLSPQELKKIMLQSNFQETSSKSIAEYHYLSTFSKTEALSTK